MNRTKATYVLIALILSAILGFLILKTRSVDFKQVNEVVSALRTLKQVDAEWNVELLRSKIGLNNNYDPVANPLPLITSLEEKIQRSTEQLLGSRGESASGLLPLLEKYKKLMSQKIALIESFKSQNAVLLNSSRFLPTAGTDLVGASQASNVSAALKNRIQDTESSLVASTMAYILTPEQALKDKIEKSAESLQQDASAMPADVQEHVAILLSHARTIVKQQQLGAKLLGELATLPTAGAIDKLSDAHNAQHEALLREQQAYRQLLVAFSSLLLLLLAYAAWRLFISYRFLNKSNVVLQKANDESQVQLRQAEKMAALGQMVAGIVHEINTPLAYVKGTFELLKDQLVPVKSLAQQSYEFTALLRAPKREKTVLTAQMENVESLSKDVVEQGLIDEMQGLLKDGIHGIEQISEIVVNLKNFSRLDRAKVSEFAVTEGLESTLLLARHMLKDKVDVRKNFANVPKITCSPSQINQVFLNIITNAVHAMVDHIEKPVITLSTSMDGNNMVRVDIEDNGSGIPQDVLPKIFDPFFTTKAVGKGTGMGLSISYKIIQEHGGQINVHSEPGVGTIFSILLPIGGTDTPRTAEQQELLRAA